MVTLLLFFYISFMFSSTKHPNRQQVTLSSLLKQGNSYWTIQEKPKKVAKVEPVEAFWPGWEQIWGAWSLSWWPWSPGWYQPRGKAWIQGVNWIHGHGLTPKVLKREFHIVHTFEFHGMKSFVMVIVDGESRIPGWLHHVTHAKFGDWWDWRHMACGDSVWFFCDGSVTLLDG